MCAQCVCVCVCVIHTSDKYYCEFVHDVRCAYYNILHQSNMDCKCNNTDLYEYTG